MNSLSSFLIDPVVRQARRLSGAVIENDKIEVLSREDRSTNAAPAPLIDDGGTPLPQDAHQNERAAPALEQLRRFSPAIRPQHSAIEDEDVGPDENDGSLHDAPLSALQVQPTTQIGSNTPASMSSNPNRSLETHLQRLQVDSPRTSTPVDIPGRAGDGATTGVASQNAVTMSESLPADDGMRHMRARIQQVRELKVADHEKARMVHSLMTERYNGLRPQSPSSFISHDRPFTPTSGHSIFSEAHASSPISTASEIDPENPFNLRPGDTDPTYRLHSHHYVTDPNGEDEDFDTAEDGSSFGCEHYKRNVKVQCFQCRHWYTCRHCHDAVENHNLNRRMTENMLCMACGTPQRAAEYCVNCGQHAAWYYCNICKLWDDNSSKKIYHCDACGICRKGEGLGKDYVHCKNCNVCISIAHATTHRCLERATDCDCPICGEYLFNSSSAVVSLPCGHYLHKDCYKAYMETAYKCPMCKKSAVNMELQWQKLTQAIETQPMPEQFANTRAVVQCNDCSAKSSVKYHWLGNKCNTCDSYNTNELQILNGPASEEAANALLSVEVDSGAARSPASVGVSSPSAQPLRSPRYYFQPDQPEETWLPGQFPSFPFQMPQLPGMPQIPQLPGMPQMPQMPQFPGMPQLPPLPQMPDPYELMERVSRSFSPFRNYLNPTGEVPVEDVPIIDLGDEHREVKATDGTSVTQPSLPQYVLERFSRSISPLRAYLISSNDNIPTLDLGEGRPFRFWGEDGGRVDRMMAGGEEEDDDDEDSSSEDSADEELDEDDVEEDGEGDDNEFELPGHR